MDVEIISGPRQWSSSKLLISEKEAQLAVKYLKTMANSINGFLKYSKTNVTGHRIKTHFNRRTSKQYISPHDLKKILKTVMLKKNVYRTKLKKISYRTEKSKSIYFFFDSHSDISNLLTSYHSSYSMFKNYAANDTVEGRVEIEKLHRIKGEEVEKMFGDSCNETFNNIQKKAQHVKEMHKSLKTYQFTDTPLIQPFLSDRQITRLQNIQEECRFESEKHQKAVDDTVDTDKHVDHYKQLPSAEAPSEKEKKTKEEKEPVITKKGKSEKDQQVKAEEKDTQPLRSKIKHKKQRPSQILLTKTKVEGKSKKERSEVSKPLKQTQKPLLTIDGKEKGSSKKNLKEADRGAVVSKQSLRSKRSETVGKIKSKSSHGSKESSKERKTLKEDEDKSITESSSKNLKSGKSSKLTLGSKKSKESQTVPSKTSSKKVVVSDTTDKEKMEKEKSEKEKPQMTFSDSESEHPGKSTKDSSPDSRKRKLVQTKQKDTHAKVATATTVDSRRTVTFRHDTEEKARQKSQLKALLKQMSGIFYQLSDHKFIVLGWTLQPKDADMSRIVTFKTVAAHPHTYCFRNREEIEKRCYPDGKLGAIFHTDGSGRVLYYSGEPAMLFTQSLLGRRVTVWSESSDDLHGSHKGNVIGIFDSYGNGVVYDERGNIRLTYDQAEGVLYDTSINIPYKWQWNSYKIVQEKRMVALLNSILLKDKTSGGKQPSSKKNSTSKPNHSQTMMATEQYLQDLAELPYPLPPKIKPSREQNTVFRPIILKLSKHITLRISAQDNIVLTFNANKLLLCLDLGIIVQPEEKIRIDDMDMGAEGIVPCMFEVLRHPTSSLLAIKKQLQLLRKDRGKNVRQTISLHI